MGSLLERGNYQRPHTLSKLKRANLTIIVVLQVMNSMIAAVGNHELQYVYAQSKQYYLTSYFQGQVIQVQMWMLQRNRLRFNGIIFQLSNWAILGNEITSISLHLYEFESKLGD